MMFLHFFSRCTHSQSSLFLWTVLNTVLSAIPQIPPCGRALGLNPVTVAAMQSLYWQYVRATSQYVQLGYISSTKRWLPGSLFFLFLQTEDISRSLVGFRVPAVLTVSTSAKNYKLSYRCRIASNASGLTNCKPNSNPCPLHNKCVWIRDSGWNPTL